jgi:hypothetical protein
MAIWSWMSGLSCAVRVATLLSSFATVILFIVFLADRTDQENIQAWQILQGYKGADYNLGQTLALSTLARNHQSLRGLQLGGWLGGVDLRGADIRFAHLMTVHLKPLNSLNSSAPAEPVSRATARAAGRRNRIMFRS